MAPPDSFRVSILALARAETVAQAAEIPVADWDRHVQWYTEPYIGSVNVGRLPMLLLSEVDTDYRHETQPDHGGTRRTTLRGRVAVRCFGVSQSSPNGPNAAYDKARAVARAFLRLVRGNTSPWELGDERVMAMEPTRYGLSLPFEIEVLTSFDNTYEEATAP